MVITCEQCETRFRLDDARIPDAGVRVRCSRCKHAFFVKPATDSGGLPIERGVAEALAQDAADLPLEVGDMTVSQPNAAARAKNGETDAGRDSESDWEFNHDPAPSHDAAMAEAQDMVDELLAPGGEDEYEAPSDFFGADDDGDDVEGDIDALLGTDADSLLGGDADSDALLGTDVDNGSLLGTDPDSDSLLGTEADSDALPQPTTPPQVETRTPLEAAVEESVEAPVTESIADDEPQPEERGVDPLADLAAEDELGSPDEWNFFDEDAAAGDHATDGVAIGRIALVPAGSVEALAPSTQDEMPAFEPDPSPVRIWMARAATVSGWVATAGLCAAMLTGGLGQTALPAAATETRAAGLELIGMQARAIDNQAAGRVVVIEGSFRASQGVTRGPGARFAVQLLAADGSVLVEDAATLGPALAPMALRRTPPQALRATLHAAGEAAAWQSVRRGAAWPFHAVVDELPAGASRFAIVAVPVDRPRGDAPAPSAPAEPTPAAGDATLSTAG